MKARRIKRMEKFQHEAYLFHLSEPFPHTEHEFVVVSGIQTSFDRNAPETLIFPSNEDGTKVEFYELHGSSYSTCDPDGVLKAVGYEIEETYDVQGT